MPNTSRKFTQGNLGALNTLIESASSCLAAKSRDRPEAVDLRSSPSQAQSQARARAQPLTSILDTENTGILFTGNPHEAVPRRLLLDNRLTPLERNAWQVFRLLLNDDGLTSFPTYEQLQPYLSASPFKVASRETVAKALTTLRLTRWLSLAGRVRDEVTGQMKGNIYLLHDEPVSISEAMLLDRNYLELVGNSLEHANKSICRVAAHTLEEFAQDPHVHEQTVPSHLEKLQQRLSRLTWSKTVNAQAHSEPGPSESELGEKHSELSESARVRNKSPLRSDSELISKQGPSHRVRNPNSSSTCTNTNTSVCKSSVPGASANLADDYPARFRALPPDQHHKACVALQPLDAQLRKNVLDQWAAKPQDSLRNPFGYLLGMIEKARNGEFNAIAPSASASASTPAMNAHRPEAPPTKPHNPNDESRAIASQQMAALMSMVGRRTPKPPGS